MARGSDTVQVGEAAPDFLLRDAAAGGEYRLADFLRTGPLILRFHRGTWCPSCRRDLAEARTAAADLRAAGVRCAFVLCQNPYRAVTALAREKDPWPFPILVDASRAVAKAYGVYVPFNWESIRIARPATFGISPDGRIRYLHVSGHQRDVRPLAEATAALTDATAR